MMAASFIVLLGPPGAGKGTQAEVLTEKTQLPHISSGDIFRENLKKLTDLGKQAQEYMNRGALVPDDLTIAMIRERLSQPDAKTGAILDGFPRTAPQAEALAKMLADLGGEVKVVPYISVPAPVLIERLSGRWTCRAQGHVYHATNKPPKVAGKCDVDGSELYQRDDDKPETVANRIKVYEEQTAPLIQYYREHGQLVEFDGTKPVEQVTAELLETVKQRMK